MIIILIITVIVIISITIITIVAVMTQFSMVFHYIRPKCLVLQSYKNSLFKSQPQPRLIRQNTYNWTSAIPPHPWPSVQSSALPATFPLFLLFSLFLCFHCFVNVFISGFTFSVLQFFLCPVKCSCKCITDTSHIYIALICMLFSFNLNIFFSYLKYFTVTRSLFLMACSYMIPRFLYPSRPTHFMTFCGEITSKVHMNVSSYQIHNLCKLVDITLPSPHISSCYL